MFSAFPYLCLSSGHPPSSRRKKVLTAASAAPANEVSQRYASALFDLATQKGELPAVAADLSAFAGLVPDSADLKILLGSPAISREDKVKALLALARKAGLSQLVANFLATMAQNGRAHDIPGAATAFDRLYADHRGVKRAVARTATAMTAPQREKLESVLAKAVGSDVELTTEVDPALVGGIQLRVGSKLIDASIAAKLERMNTAMKGA